MSRESRANLIFLAIFLAIALPGAIVLVRKKLDPAAAPMGGPPTVKDRLVYFDPLESPPGFKRLVPTITANWVGDLARDRFGTTAVPRRVDADGQSSPILSENRLVQLVGVQSSSSTQRIALLVWNVPREGGDVTIAIDAATGEKTVPVGAIATESIPLPPQIIKDLHGSGLATPPQRVLLAEFALDWPLSSRGVELTIRLTTARGIVVDRLTLPE